MEEFDKELDMDAETQPSPNPDPLYLGKRVRLAKFRASSEEKEGLFSPVSDTIQYCPSSLFMTKMRDKLFQNSTWAPATFTELTKSRGIPSILEFRRIKNAEIAELILSQHLVDVCLGIKVFCDFAKFISSRNNQEGRLVFQNQIYLNRQHLTVIVSQLTTLSSVSKSSQRLCYRYLKMVMMQQAQIDAWQEFTFMLELLKPNLERDITELWEHGAVRILGLVARKKPALLLKHFSRFLKESEQLLRKKPEELDFLEVPAGPKVAQGSRLMYYHLCLILYSCKDPHKPDISVGSADPRTYGYGLRHLAPLLRASSSSADPLSTPILHRPSSIVEDEAAVWPLLVADTLHFILALLSQEPLPNEGTPPPVVSCLLAILSRSEANRKLLNSLVVCNTQICTKLVQLLDGTWAGFILQEFRFDRPAVQAFVKAGAVEKLHAAFLQTTRTACLRLTIYCTMAIWVFHVICENEQLPSYIWELLVDGYKVIQEMLNSQLDWEAECLLDIAVGILRSIKLSRNANSCHQEESHISVSANGMTCLAVGDSEDDLSMILIQSRIGLPLVFHHSNCSLSKVNYWKVPEEKLKTTSLRLYKTPQTESSPSESDSSDSAIPPTRSYFDKAMRYLYISGSFLKRPKSTSTTDKPLLQQLIWPSVSPCKTPSLPSLSYPTGSRSALITTSQLLWFTPGTRPLHLSLRGRLAPLSPQHLKHRGPPLAPRYVLAVWCLSPFPTVVLQLDRLRLERTRYELFGLNTRKRSFAVSGGPAGLGVWWKSNGVWGAEVTEHGQPALRVYCGRARRWGSYLHAPQRVIDVDARGSLLTVLCPARINIYRIRQDCPQDVDLEEVQYLTAEISFDLMFGMPYSMIKCAGLDFIAAVGVNGANPLLAVIRCTQDSSEIFYVHLGLVGLVIPAESSNENDPEYSNHKHFFTGCHLTDTLESDSAPWSMMDQNMATQIMERLFETKNLTNPLPHKREPSILRSLKRRIAKARFESQVTALSMHSNPNNDSAEILIILNWTERWEERVPGSRICLRVDLKQTIDGERAH